MLTKILFREYDYPNNIISGTRGDPVIAGTGTKFTEIAIGTSIEAEGLGFIGKVLSVESDTSMTLDRGCKDDISDVLFWQDWSIWRLESSAVNKKVESDNPGEAGVVVFDNVNMTFYMGDSLTVNGTEYLNPVKAAFSGDIDSKKRFIIKKLGVKYDYPEVYGKIVSEDYLNDIVTEAGQYLETEGAKELQSRAEFEGVVDFTTITMPSIPNDDGEDFNTISFDVVDKLTALNTLALMPTRVEGFIKPDVINNALESVEYFKTENRNDFGMNYVKYVGASVTLYTINYPYAPDVGDLIVLNFLDGQNGTETYLGLILTKYLDESWEPGYNRMHYKILPNFPDWYAGKVTGAFPSRLATTQRWIDALFCDENIFLEEATSYEWMTTSGLETHTGWEITAINGIKLIEAILKQRWPDASIVNKLKDGSGTTMATFPLPLNFIFQLLDEFPFGKESLEALAYIVNAIDCWIFTDIDGNFVLQNKNSFEFPETTPALTVIDLDLIKIKSATKKIFWDKLVDSVVMNVLSWIPNPLDTTQFLDGVGYAFKVTGIKPRNEMTKDVIIDKATLDRYGFEIYPDGSIIFPGGTFGGITYPPLSDQSAVLNQYGDFKAIEKMEFYGKRHESYDIEMLKVTWELLLWQLLFLFNYYAKQYFMVNLSSDIDEDVIKFTMVSVLGYDYNLDNVIIGKQRDEYLAGNN
jgi:hypothetical protein